MKTGQRCLLSLGVGLDSCCRLKSLFATAAKLAVQISCCEISLHLIWTLELHLILELGLSLYKIQWRAVKEV